MPLSITKHWFLLALGSMLIANNAAAEISQNSWRQMNQNIVSQHILPGYEELLSQATRLELSTTQLCKAPTTENLETSRHEFRSTLAAWQGIQHITFGPIELLMRSYSIQFWPDKKNLTSKQLNKLLQAEDPDALTDTAFQTASIAVKGLPAMERILFSDKAIELIQQSPFRCQLLHAISNYLKDQSEDTYREWQAFQTEFTYLESEEGQYESAQEASIDLLKSQIEPLEIIRDLKLIRPLGKQKAKTRRLESWRSQHSLQNIQINLQSLHHMYSGLEGANLYGLLKEQGAIDLANKIEQQFTELEHLIEGIPTPLEQHIHDEVVRNKLQMLAEGIERLGKYFETSMKHIQIQLGFNSRDGD